MKKLFLFLAFLTFLVGTVGQAFPYTITVNYEQGTPQAVSNVGGTASLSDLTGISVEGSGWWTNPGTLVTTTYTFSGTVQMDTLYWDGVFMLHYYTQIAIGEINPYYLLTPPVPDPSIVSSTNAIWRINYLGGTSDLDSVSFNSQSAGIAFDAGKFSIINYSGYMFLGDIVVTFSDQVSLNGQLQDNLYNTMSFQFLSGLEMSNVDFYVGTDIVSYVPIPSTLLLLGSGLLGLVGWRRFRKS